ncbi:probable cytosolic oligopeptidase A [Olea europaea var. sylvestris]|uniref:probable cytosolic oligopeptidase A n=1 Tax=Olea europaea var. sylvestris TaxID=158386 RepID=UPI000C1D50D5|nr:probable cytosolic oligopeptidase A [Olea europaea var. sylvestris]
MESVSITTELHIPSVRYHRTKTSSPRNSISAKKTLEPTWPKLVVPLEKIIDRLSVVWGIVKHLSSVKDSPKLRRQSNKFSPKKLSFS